MILRSTRENGRFSPRVLRPSRGRVGGRRQHNTRSWFGDRVHTERPSSVRFPDVVNRCRFLSSRLPNHSRDLQPSVVPCRFALRNNNIICVAHVEKKILS